ncbi:hypothetical protein DERP_002795 [Dermatophagoides pteronyssinus]|uniref:Uncharacterized protein n=1 Tax=Dermatophagoides pteronyssinus TaxID=6956 RepID=A0ABQ8JVN7_DERPT|nr:hypothetical protein DERP_002795 [Dermatophagoides pteronyssinus]
MTIIKFNRLKNVISFSNSDDDDNSIGLFITTDDGVTTILLHYGSRHKQYDSVHYLVKSKKENQVMNVKMRKKTSR